MKKTFRLYTLIILALTLIVSLSACDDLDIDSLLDQLPDEIKNLHEHSWDNWKIVYGEDEASLVCELCGKTVKSQPYSEGLDIQDGVLVGMGTCTDTEIAVPYGVTEIAKGAFEGCSDITGVLLPETLTTIGEDAFKNCDSLSLIHFPEGITEIGENAFKNCKNLVAILLPNSIKTIGSKAFENCQVLGTIAFVGTEEEWNTVEKGKDWDKGAGKHAMKYKDKHQGGNGGGTGNGGEEKPDDHDTPHSHTWSEWKAVEDATCTSEGKERRECPCGSYEIQSTEKAEHTEVIDKGTEPSCSSNGLTEGKHCSDCGEILVVQQEIPPISHVYDNDYDTTCNECGHVRDAKCSHKNISNIKGIAATCTKAGLTDGQKCVDCGEMLVEQSIIDPLGHDYKAITTAPTCKVQGYTVHTCSRCNDSYTDSYADAKGHSFGEWTIIKNPTATATGLKERTCTCGEKKTEIIPVLEQSEGSQGLEYELNTDGKSYSVVGIGTCTDRDIIIPSIYNKLPVTNVSYDAFQSCSSITSITFSDGIQSIGSYVFAGCDSLTNVIIPESITSIGGYAFWACPSLTNIEVDKNNQNYKSVDGNLYSKDGSLFIQYVPGKTDTSFVIPNGVKNIAEAAFYGCKSLTNITIPNSVINISQDVFIGCKSLTSISFGGTIEQWNAIEKGYDWNQNSYFLTIVCTNGEIAKDGTVTYYN